MPPFPGRKLWLFLSLSLMVLSPWSHWPTLRAQANQSAAKAPAASGGGHATPAAPPSTPHPAAPEHFSISGPHIQGPAAGYKFPNGQVLNYTADWHLFTAGMAVVKMEPEGPLQKVTVTAESTGVVSLLFGVHDRFQAIFDPKTFCSLSVFKHSEEGFHKRETQIHFEYARGKSVLEEKNLVTGEQKKVENDIGSCNTDVVSGIFYLGTLPLQEGYTYTFPVADGSKANTAVAHVEGTEKVKTPAGTFDTVRVVTEASDEPLKSKGKLWIWYTDDAAHVPVQMRARLFWGTLQLQLTSMVKAGK